MKKNFYRYSSLFIDRFLNNFVSTWLILAFDIVVCALAFTMAYVLRYNFRIPPEAVQALVVLLFLDLAFKLLFFLNFKTYTGVVRHTSTEDLLLITKTQLASTVTLILFSYVSHSLSPSFPRIPGSVAVIDFFASVSILSISRILIKRLYVVLLADSKAKSTHIIIYGAGKMGLMLKNVLLQHGLSKQMKVLCFVDDAPEKINKTLEGIEILSLDNALYKHIEHPNRKNIEVIFAIEEITAKRKKWLSELFLEKGILVKTLSSIEKWLNGQASLNEITNIKIEDLLGREPIKIKNQQIENFLQDKVVVVTGAAGSIGSELVRQLLHYPLLNVVVIDQAETPMFHLENQINQKFSPLQAQKVRYYIASVTDRHRIETIFAAHQPHVVFHAAAYKHVPLMESNVSEAIKVNLLGTQVVADLASQMGVEKFVFISTDKAVNPTNVMGQSKKMAEQYVLSKNGLFDNPTSFIVTRFGNVLGSNGSVIPTFKKQIEEGGPLTVTHPDIVRYFMTIPEACQLVIEACTMGEAGQLYVFDMGDPIKISDLAQKMLKLAGKETEIEIVYTGLRPGEKLYEELFNTAETLVDTHHAKIKIAHTTPINHGAALLRIEALRGMMRLGDEQALQYSLMQPEELSREV